MYDYEKHNELDLGEVLPGIHLIRACRDDSKMSREDYALKLKGRVLVTFDTCPWSDPLQGDDRKQEELDREELRTALDWAHAARDFEGNMLLSADSIMSLWRLVMCAREVGWGVDRDDFGSWLFHRIGTHLAKRKERKS